MKKLLSTMAVVAALLFSSSTSFAASEKIPTVTFDGSTSLTYNVKENEFGKSFEGMLPSEKRTLEIKLKNTSKSDIDFYMSAKVLKAFEEANKAEGGAYIVSLAVKQNKTTTMIYGDVEGSSVGANKSGLYDLNGSLNDNFKVATIAKEQEASVFLNVEIDGASVRNSYQGLPGQFQFDFTAQYLDPKETTIVNNVNKVVYDKVTTFIESVKTGDPTSVGAIVGVLIIAGATVIFFKKKGGRTNEK